MTELIGIGWGNTSVSVYIKERIECRITRSSTYRCTESIRFHWIHHAVTVAITEETEEIVCRRFAFDEIATGGTVVVAVQGDASDSTSNLAGESCNPIVAIRKRAPRDPRTTEGQRDLSFASYQNRDALGHCECDRREHPSTVDGAGFQQEGICIQNDIGIKRNNIIAEALQIDAQLGSNFHNGNMKRMKRWVYCWMNRYRLSIRQTTRIGQKLSGHLDKVRVDTVQAINHRFSKNGSLHGLQSRFFKHGSNSNIL